MAQSFGQNVQRQRDQAVGLLHVAGHFSQIAVGGQSDRTAHHGADALQDAPLHLASQFHGRHQRPLPAHQPAGHLVHRHHRRHRQAALHGLDDAVMILDIQLVARLDQHQAGTELLGVGDHDAGFDAKSLGLVTGCKATGCVGHHGHNGHWAVAQLGPGVLFHRGKIGVHIDEEPIEPLAVVQAGFRRLGSTRQLRLQGLKLLGPLLEIGGNGG